MKAARNAVVFLTVSIAGCLAGSVLQEAPPRVAHLKNRFEGDEQGWRAGAKLYARECSACHGSNREGHGKAPSLNRPDVMQALPGAIFWVLQNGSLRRGMPSFAHLPEPQRWQIITFLQR